MDNTVQYRKGFKNTLKFLSETRYSYNGNNSSSDSSEFASNDQNSQSNTLTESSGKFYRYFSRVLGEYFTSNLFLDDEDIPIKKSKNRKNERDEIMAVIRKNPEDFGVRRSSRGPPTLSESSNDDDGSTSDSSDDFKPIKK